MSSSRSNSGSSSDGLDLPARYTIRESIGVTRSGGVYRCRDLEGGEDVALKVYLSGLRSSGIGESIRRERAAHEALRSPHIPPLLDAGTTPAGHVYHAFPLAGRGDGVGRGAISPEVTERALQGALRALDTANRDDRVHADVAPSNLLEADDGCWWLGDWGSSHRSDDPAALDTRSLGSPGTMGPEQMRGERVTPQGDLFSLAMSITWLHSGRCLLESLSVAGLAPLFADLRPLASRRLEGLRGPVREGLLECLHPEPAERPASAHVLECAAGVANPEAPREDRSSP